MGDEGAPDHVWFEDIFPRMAGLKRSFSALAGCDPDEVALTTNISIALATIASCLDPASERRTVILSELDFPTDGHVWLAWAKKPAARFGGCAAPTGSRSRSRSTSGRSTNGPLVMVNRVLFRSSAIVDAKAVCASSRDRGALSFVDDYHGLGIVPLDLHDLGCDLYAAGVLKWMLGGPGLVFLYARRDLLPSLEPAVTGWFGQADPFVRPRASGLPPCATPGARDAAGAGVLPRAGRHRHHLGGRARRDRDRQGELTDHVIARADEAGLEVRTPRARDARGGVVNVRVGPEAEKICHQLLARTCAPTSRGDGLRISPHFFNTEQDIDRCFEEPRSLVRRSSADEHGHALHHVVHEAAVPRRLRLDAPGVVGRPDRELVLPGVASQRKDRATSAKDAGGGWLGVEPRPASIHLVSTRTTWPGARTTPTDRGRGPVEEPLPAGKSVNPGGTISARTAFLVTGTPGRPALAELVEPSWNPSKGSPRPR